MCWHLFTWGGQFSVLAPRKLTVMLNVHLPRVAAAAECFPGRRDD